MPDSPERKTRKFPRYEVNALVDVTTPADVLLYHKIQNLSLGGICIQSPTIEDVGTIIDLVINFPDGGEPLSLKGEVAWVNREPPMDMGIRYLGVDEVSRERLKKLIASVK